MPVTPAQTPTLLVWWEDATWRWEAVDPDGDGRFDVRIGPVIDGRIEPTAVYQWSRETSAWVGPAGSRDGPLLRPDPTGEDPDAIAFPDGLDES